MSSDPRTVPYRPRPATDAETLVRLRADFVVADQRRTVRRFSERPVPKEAIETAIKIASTAPSGAHRQPWHFAAISDPEMKGRIRAAAEAEETAFYEERAPDDWLEALAPIGTDASKPHITEAPWVVVVFRQSKSFDADGKPLKNYYMTESVGIAVGFFVQALHRAGLATLTHTPAPMTFLREICQRPEHEKPFVLLPVGYPHPEARVPDLRRKELDEVSSWF